MGNERTNDTEKELNCRLYWSLLLCCCCWCCSTQLLSRSRFCRLFSRLWFQLFVLSLSQSDYFLRVLSNWMTEVLKRGDMSLINCTVSEKRSLPNVIEIRINARMHSNAQCTFVRPKQRKELFHLFHIGVAGFQIENWFYVCFIH